MREQWTRPTSWGTICVRAAVEAQHWDRAAAILDTDEDDREEDESDLAFLGGIVSVGFMR